MKKILKWGFFIAVFLAIIFTVMANMGGNSDVLKSSIEEYVEEATGYEAEVLLLNNMSFFPNIVFDFEGLELRNKSGGDPVVTVRKFALSMGFWDTVMRTGKVKALYVNEVFMQEGVMGPNPIQLENFGILDPEGEQPHLVVEGAIGEYPVTASVEMTAKGIQWGRRYSFPEDRAVSVQVGDVSLSGVSRNKPDRFVLSDAEVLLKGEAVFNGEAEAYMDENEDIFVSGQIVLAQKGTHVWPEMKVVRSRGEEDETVIAGHVVRDPYKADDYKAGGRLDSLVRYIEGIILEDGEKGLGTEILSHVQTKQDKDCDAWEVEIHGAELYAINRMPETVCGEKK